MFVNVACAAWLAAKLWRRRRKAGTVAHRREQPQAGQRWRLASALAIAVALAGHLGSAELRVALADQDRGGSGLCDALSAALCLLLLVSGPERLHVGGCALLATPHAGERAASSGCRCKGSQPPPCSTARTGAALGVGAQRAAVDAVHPCGRVHGTGGGRPGRGGARVPAPRRAAGRRHLGGRQLRGRGAGAGGRERGRPGRLHRLPAGGDGGAGRGARPGRGRRRRRAAAGRRGGAAQAAAGQGQRAHAPGQRHAPVRGARHARAQAQASTRGAGRADGRRSDWRAADCWREHSHHASFPPC